MQSYKLYNYQLKDTFTVEELTKQYNKLLDIEAKDDEQAKRLSHDIKLTEIYLAAAEKGETRFTAKITDFANCKLPVHTVDFEIRYADVNIAEEGEEEVIVKKFGCMPLQKGYSVQLGLSDKRPKFFAPSVEAAVDVVEEHLRSNLNKGQTKKYKIRDYKTHKVLIEGSYTKQ